MLWYLHGTLSALLAGLLAAGGAAAAAGVAGEVHDEAGFFSADAVARANQAINDIHRDFKKDLLIETFKSVPAPRLDEVRRMDKAARSNFFNTWARDNAKAARVNGIYILICKDPGHLEVEVGNVTSQKAFPPASRNVLANRMLDKFGEAAKLKDENARKKLHDQALDDAVTFVHGTLKFNLGSEAAEAAAEGKAARPGHSWTASLGGLLCMGLLVALCIWLVVGLIRAFSGGGGWGGGGGGFMTGLLGGLFGAMAGAWLYDHFFRGDSWGSSSAHGSDAGHGSSEPHDTDYSGSGGDYGGGDAGGGDFGGGGGDFGGGGGDFGGGDFGGGGDF
jgi:uncharacterized protein